MRVWPNFDYRSPYFAALNLTSSDSEVIDSLTISAQAFIEKWCRRHFVRQEWDLVFPVEQDSSIILANPPVDHISRVCRAYGNYLSIANETAQSASFSTNKTALNLNQMVNGVRG